MANTRSGYLTKDGVPHQIIQFLANNPDEELTVEIVSARFGCSITTAYRAMTRVLEISPEIEHVKVLRLSAKGTGNPNLIASAQARLLLEALK